ncbi:uncharacterized protein VP01_1112g1 [Puccinia sorghi]|uniref:Integrase catalytic domain-containing protein n=1 Tax=Puccinia sorghi TaxID=27349 RepID=A0A0L6VST7_9BASI|nr:uncharacterized protein VP01_1112g1 [Puccinia sorghi]
MLEPSHETTEKLSVVSCDLMGPFDPATMLGGNEVKILKSKSEAAKVMILMIKRQERQAGFKLKMLHSDNSGEFDSKFFLDSIQDCGIHAEWSLPYHHFQNGAAERYNHTVSNMGLGLM